MRHEIRPEFRYFLRSNMPILLLPVIIFGTYLFVYDQLNRLPAYIILATYLLVLFYLIYQYLYIRSTCWTITSEQLIYRRGVMAVETDYLELYRINDFSEYSTVIDRIFGIKNILITSTDQSTPKLLMRGIDIDTDVLSSLREKVEQMKQKRRIYELSNY